MCEKEATRGKITRVNGNQKQQLLRIAALLLMLSLVLPNQIFDVHFRNTDVSWPNPQPRNIELSAITINDTWTSGDYVSAIEGIFETFNYFNLSKYGGGWQYEVTRDWTDRAFTYGKFIWQDSECIMGLLAAYNLTANQSYLDYAEDIWNWDQVHFWDDVYGGYYVRLNQDNSIAIGDKGMFEHGWFGLATAELYATTGNTSYLNCISETYSFVTDHFYDPSDGSYFGALTRSLTVSVSDIDTNWVAPYARFLTTSFRETANATYGDKATELIDNILEYAFDPTYGWIVNRVSSDWSSFTYTAKGWYDVLQTFIDAYQVFGNSSYLSYAQSFFDDIQQANSTAGYLQQMNRDWTSNVNNELLGEEDPGVAIAYLRIASELGNNSIAKEAFRYKDAIFSGLHDPVYDGIYRRIYSSGSQSTWKQWCGGGRVMEMLAVFAANISIIIPLQANNMALYFDGSDEVVVPSDTSLNPTSGITVMAWIKADDWDGNRRIVQKGVDDQYRLVEEGALEFSLAGLSGADIETPLPSTGVWHHVAGTYDGSTIRLYVDGVERASQSVTGPIQTSSTSLYIGNKPLSSYSGDFFKGIIDEVRIYNRSLSDQEINDTMINESPASNGLVLYLNFETLYGPICPDLSGYGNNGTNNGAEIVTSFDWGDVNPSLEYPTIPEFQNLPASITTNSFSVHWNESTVVGSEIVEYELEVDTSDSFSSPSQYVSESTSHELQDLMNGTYYLRVRAIDDKNFRSSWSAIGVVFVQIADTIAPTVSEPIDVTIEAGTIGSYLIWITYELYPDNFEITRNGVVVSSGDWNQDAIQIEIDTFHLGNFHYTITLYDESGNSANDTVVVHIVDTTEPTINHPPDQSFEQTDRGNSIIWTVEDLFPDYVEIYRNGTLIGDIDWNGSTVTFNVAGLEIGMYNFTIVVFDTSGNNISDSVWITVMEQSPNVEMVISVILIGGSLAVVIILGTCYMNRKRGV